MVLKHRIFDIPLRKVPFKTPLIVDENDSLEKVIKLMAEKDYNFIVVHSKDNGLGIITEKDIIRKVLAFGKNYSQIKAKEVASFPLIRLDGNNLLFEAILLMAEKKVRKIAVFENDVLQGIIEDTDIITFQSKNLVSLLYQIEIAHELEELARLYSLVKEAVLREIQEGFDPEYLGKYLAEINDRFIKKAFEITLNELEKTPPCDFALFVLGSEGRKEQTFKTDQDNALVYEHLQEKHKEVEIYFKTFSETFIENLLKIGFPRCPGEVMISNSLWRGDLKQWKEKLKDWFNFANKDALLNLSIFLDFRLVIGKEILKQELQNFIKQELEKNKRALAYLASEAIKFEPPLNIFGKFITEKEGPQKGKIDLKKYGIFPIVQGIRTLAIDNNIWESNTFERIRKLNTMGVLSDSFAIELLEGYKFLLSLIFKHQALKFQEGFPVDNFIDPNLLTKTEKHSLKSVFKLIKNLQEFLFKKYNLRNII